MPKSQINENINPDRQKAEQVSSSDQPELKKTYRSLLAGALGAARNYRGSEQKAETLIQHLIKLEKWLTDCFGENGQTHLADKQEEAVYEQLCKEERKDLTISAILELAISRFKGWMAKMSTEENIKSALNKLDTLSIKLDGIILPPDESEINTGNGVGGFEKGRFMERLQQLILFLNRNNIYTDDLVVCWGDLLPNQMRELSYYLVEIPRLQKQILVCDQVGETTFVIDGIFDRKTLLKLTKKELQKDYPNKVTKVIYLNSTQWESRLAELLFQNIDNGQHILPKININEAEEVRQELCRRYDPQTWMTLTSEERKKIKLHGKGLNALARLFDVQGNPVDNLLPHLELGAKIFGDDTPEIKTALEKERTNKNKQKELGNDPVFRG